MSERVTIELVSGFLDATADHHIQHTYTKIGVSTRAAAALWATRHAVVS